MKTMVLVVLALLATTVVMPEGPGLRAKAVPPSPEVMAEFKELCDKEDAVGVVKFWEKHGTDSYPCDLLNPQVKQALVSFPREKFIPALLVGMKSDKRFVADFCIRTLADFKEERALKYIIEKVIPPTLSNEEKKRATALAKDLGHEEYEKRKVAEESLIAMGPGVMKILESLTMDNDPQVAWASKQIIETVAPCPITYIDVIALQVFADRAALPALRILARREGLNHNLRLNVILALREFATMADADLLRSYLEGDLTGPVCSLLGNLKDSKSVPKLIELITDDKYSSIAVFTLGKIGDKRAIEPIEAEMARRSGTKSKAICIKALAQLGVKKYLYEVIEKEPENSIVWTHILDACDENDIDVVCERAAKMHNAVALGYVALWLANTVPGENERAVKEINRARKRAESNGALTASLPNRLSIALIKLGDKKEEKAVIALTNDKNPRTRYNALLVLAQLRDERFLPVFIKACDDKATFEVTYYPGNVVTTEVRQAAIKVVTGISGEPLHLWDFDRDRQMREIKAWWEKYQEQKAAEDE